MIRNGTDAILDENPLADVIGFQVLTQTSNHNAEVRSHRYRQPGFASKTI